MKTRKNVCVVVDAYSTGNTLAGIFAGYGYSTIHIQSGDNIPKNIIKSFRPDSFIESIIFDGNLAALEQKLYALDYNIQCVVAGAECGVELADALSERLKLMTNGTQLSRARRNKFIMMETIRQNGLNAIKQIKSNSLQDILDWVIQNKIFPKFVVLKPIESSSTDGFHICRNEGEIKEAYQQLHMSKDVFGNVNDEILAQTYLEGQEYCVNAVSHDGKHYISEVWQINKQINGFSKVYDLMELIDVNHPFYESLSEYAKQVITTLGIKYGPSHTEIIITPEGKPTLVESAARLMGAQDLSMTTKAYGTNAALLTAESYLAPEAFLSRIEHPVPKMKSCAYMVMLISKEAGVLQSYDLGRIRSMSTFHGFDAFVPIGNQIKQTVDTSTAPGEIFLSGAMKENLEKDYAEIRRLEQEGLLYNVTPEQNYSNVYPIGSLPTLLSNRNKPVSPVKKSNDEKNYSVKYNQRA